jgi:prevent-host-death family protein
LRFGSRTIACESCGYFTRVATTRLISTTRTRAIRPNWELITHKVGAFEAGNKLGQLLDWVDAGEEVVITRRGRVVARLAPPRPAFDPDQASNAAAAIREAWPTEGPGPRCRRPLVSLVLDASLTLCWYFEDERTPAIDAVLDRVVASSAVVPSLWRMEVANGFQMAIRHKRIDKDFHDRAIRQLSLLPIVIDPESDTNVWTATLRLSDRFGLTVYDATYLELAQRRNLPLASIDKALSTAGELLGLAILGRKR